MTDHRCTAHDNTDCRMPHINRPYVRPTRYDQAPSGDWRVQDEDVIWTRTMPIGVEMTVRRIMVIGFIVLAVTALIVGLAIAGGKAAADGYGPLLPATATPSPTPYPQGWTR